MTPLHTIHQDMLPHIPLGIVVCIFVDKQTHQIYLANYGNGQTYLNLLKMPEIYSLIDLHEQNFHICSSGKT